MRNKSQRAPIIICIRDAVYIGILLLVFLTQPLAAFAAGEGVVAADNVSAKPGETADIAVRIEHNPGIVAAMLHIDYDSSALTLTGVDNGEVFADETAVFGRDLTHSPYTVLWEDGLSPENHTADGVLAILHFAVDEDAGAGDCSIRLETDTSSTFDVDLHTVSLQTRNGTVHIEPVSAVHHVDILIAGIAASVVVCLAVIGTVVIRKRRIHARNG